MAGISPTYYYNDSPSYDGSNYTRGYYAYDGLINTDYNPGAFFNTFGSKSNISLKLGYAKTGLGIPEGSDTFTDTYDPTTGSTSTGAEFRFICSFSSYYARDQYKEYSIVADPIDGLYDTYIKNTSSATYIDSAEYDSSWSTTTDSAHGRVIIGTVGNANSIIVSDYIIEVNNDITPKLNNAYSLGDQINKWNSIYVGTVYADNYEGVSSSQLSVNNLTQLEATTSYGLVSSANIIPSSSYTYNLGSSNIKWNEIHVGTIYADTYNGIPSGGSSSELVYNDSTKIEATSTGATIYGSVVPSSSATYNFGSTNSRWNDSYFKTIHAWGSTSSGGAIKLCDGNYESSSYCAITGYNNNTQTATMTIDFIASGNINYRIELAGPNTSSSGNETLTTIPSSSGTWSLGNSSYKLGDIYCTKIHADTCNGNCFSNTQSANTQSRTISASGYSLTEGVLMSVYFKYSHSGATTPTLNINSTGAFNLVDVSGESIKTWNDDTQMFLYYDSTFQNTSSNQKYVVIWRSDTGVIASSGTGQNVGNVTFGTSSVTTNKLDTNGTTTSSTITPYSSVSVSGTNVTDSLMKTIAWRFGGGVASYGQSDSNGSNVGAIGLFALRRSSPTSTGSISSIQANNICAGSCLYQLEIHSTGLTSSTATATSISLHVFNYWRSGTWLILTPYLNNFQGMSIVLATQILA